MKKKWKVHFAGLEVVLGLDALIGGFLLWVGLCAAGVWLLHLPLSKALLDGFLATLLHYASELWHQLGHALAARRTGYPMRGIRSWWLLTLSRYPGEEPELPAEVHLQRALGGPIGSLLLALLAAGAAYALRAPQGLAYRLTLFLFLDNLLVFTLGALLPLGFTDGSTLLRWWPKRGR